MQHANGLGCVLTLALVVGLGACAVVQSTPLGLRIAPGDSVALLPIANHTDVPQAGLRAESIVEASLRAKGIGQLQIYPPQLNPETLFEPSERKAQLESEKWAKAQGIRYAVYGSVDEWRYKVGLDGEPAVGMVFHVKDLKSNEVVFSASGGRTGFGREALSAVAQKLTLELLKGVQAGTPVAPVRALAPAGSAPQPAR